MILFCGIRYIVKSNRESGNGRSDIIIREYQLRKLAVIIEIKVAEKFSELDKKCDDALQQIEDRNNEVELIDECYQNIIKYGVAFYHKSCKIKKPDVLIKHIRIQSVEKVKRKHGFFA